MRVVVPYDARRPKTRLADALGRDERAEFAHVMLTDVLVAIRDAERAPPPTVIATAPVDIDTREPLDAEVVIDERPLDPAINERLDAISQRAEGGTDAVAVIMADLPLVTPEAVDRLLASEAGVVLVPGRGGGTNALVARDPEFRVDYHGVSIRDHRRIARQIGASVWLVDSYRLSTDVDEREDLPEVLLHGEGRSADWLRDRGFEVAVVDGRVGIRRE